MDDNEETAGVDDKAPAPDTVRGACEAPADATGLLAADVGAWQAALATVAGELGDASRVDLLGALERLKSAAGAAQLRLAAAMAADRVAGAADRDAQTQAVRSVAGQVGLARRVSPARASTFVGLARLLCRDMPDTLAALAAGQISEWQATLIGRETVILAPADRTQVDAALAPLLGPLGDRGVAQQARRLVDRVDPGAVARRVKSAEADRRVTVRPAPGPAGCAMARLTATMPVAQAVAAYAGLRRQADSLRNQGDPRGIGQIMSDELFARLTGVGSGSAFGSLSGSVHPASSPAATAAGGVGVEVGLVMTERTLLRGGREPAVLTDPGGRAFGHVPAFLARRLVREAERAWLTRLYAAPSSGGLVAMDSQRRAFTGRLRRLLVWRDQTCRTPWCEAPIRHADHIRSHASGGPTELANGAGLCEACNYLKEADGWRADIIAQAGHVIEITTPSGHRYRSQAPPAPGQYGKDLEEHLEHAVDDWEDGVGGAA